MCLEYAEVLYEWRYHEYSQSLIITNNYSQSKIPMNKYPHFYSQSQNLANIRNSPRKNIELFRFRPSGILPCLVEEVPHQKHIP
jgi:hypothetical protein